MTSRRRGTVWPPNGSSSPSCIYAGGMEGDAAAPDVTAEDASACCAPTTRTLSVPRTFPQMLICRHPSHGLRRISAIASRRVSRIVLTSLGISLSFCFFSRLMIFDEIFGETEAVMRGEAPLEFHVKAKG